MTKGNADGQWTCCSGMTRFDVVVVIEAQVLETEELSSQLALSLSLIQGTVLNHEPSKRYLGRRCSLEVRNEPPVGLNKLMPL